MDFKNFDTIIDARTPAEYALDHIPGAVSAPVLSDAQRAEVGTLYKQVSPFEAKKLGGALVAQNVARHVETLFKGRDRAWKPLIYCWRGGKRSGAMAHILRDFLQSIDEASADRTNALSFNSPASVNLSLHSSSDSDGAQHNHA